ncbi:MAG: diacylglycerol/polyprenol kinase family protein [Promethearchaeota archaeon]
MILLLDLFLVFLTYLYIIVAIQIPIQLKKRDKISKFTARKIVHLFAGLSILSTPFFDWVGFAVIIAGSLTILTFLSSKESKVKQLKELYDSIGEEAEEKVGYLQGPFHYCLSILSLVTFFAIFAQHQMYFPIAGILIMIISDTLASVVGKKYGKINIKLPWLNTLRTLEGSLTFFISAFLLCLFSYTVFGLTNPITQIHLTVEQVLLFSLITSLLATIIELISPSTWDDLTVPILTTLIMFLLTLTLI